MIEITPIYLVLAAVIGLLVGLLIANIFSGRESRDQKKNQPPKEMQTEGFIDAIRLWFSPAGKKIIIEMDDEYYREPNTLTTDQKTRVLKFLSLWQEWAGQNVKIQPVTPQEEVYPAAEMKYVEEFEPAEVAKPEPDMYEEFKFEERILPEVEKTPEEQFAPIPPFKSSPEEYDAVSDLQASLEYQEEEPQAEPVEKKNLSITEQIGAILEEMLEGTPLKEKGIKLIENQLHGVDVWVGMNKYEGIDSVPDQEVKDLIRNAVIRWEQENESKN